MDYWDWLRDELEAVMKERGWSTAELVRRAGLKYNRVNAFLAGVSQEMRKDAILALEAATGRSLQPRPQAQTPPRATGQPDPDTVQSYGEETEKGVPAIDLDVMDQMPMELEGDAFMAEVRTRRYDLVPVEASAPGLFAIRLHVNVGDDYKAGERLLLSRFHATQPEEHVLVKAKGRRWFGEYNLDEEGVPTVSLWGGGGVVKKFRILGTILEATRSTTKPTR